MFIHSRGASAQHGLSLSCARPSHIDQVLRPDDLVIAVCDNAHEHLDPLEADRLAPAVHFSGGRG